MRRGFTIGLACLLACAPCIVFLIQIPLDLIVFMIRDLLPDDPHELVSRG